MKYFKSENGTLGSQMPFNFALISDLSRNSSAADFKNITDSKIASVPKGTRLNWVMGNHDKPRVGSRYGERRIDGLLTLVMTLPGIAVTYNVRNWLHFLWLHDKMRQNSASCKVSKQKNNTFNFPFGYRVRKSVC